MDLEQRVQMLEQELQILKGQIQATLLDIQEQLLTNAYPALRASAPPQRPLTAPVPTEPTPAASTRRPAKAEIINDDDDDDFDDDAPALPSIVKRVTLDGIEPPAAKQPPTVKAKATKAAPPIDKPKAGGRGKATYQPDDDIDDDFEDEDDDESPVLNARPGKSNASPAKPAKNAKNARAADPEPDEPDNGVDEQDLAVFGRPKTRPNAKPAAQPNKKPAPQPDMTHEIQPDEWAEIWPDMWPDDEASNWPPKLSVPDPLGPAPVTTSLTLSNGPDWTSLNRLAEWVGKKVKDVGTQATKDIIEMNAQRGTFSPEVKAALTQLVVLYDDDGALNTTKIDEALEGLNKPPEVNPEDSKVLEQTETSRLILRLIAGVQNAGAGMTRKKK